nr:hypothetical protein [Streptomyces carpinensis]
MFSLTRTSMCATALPATTLRRLPPVTTPALSVVPRWGGGEFRRCQHGVGDCGDGAGAEVGFESGVGFDAGGGDVEVGDALPGDL